MEEKQTVDVSENHIENAVTQLSGTVSKMDQYIRSGAVLLCKACPKHGDCEFEGKYKDAQGKQRCQLEFIETRRFLEMLSYDYDPTLNLKTMLQAESAKVSHLCAQRCVESINNDGMFYFEPVYDKQGNVIREERVANPQANMYMTFDKHRNQNINVIEKENEKQQAKSQKERKQQTVIIDGQAKSVEDVFDEMMEG